MPNINEYKIENFIFSITFDNASLNNSAIEILKIQLNPMVSGNFFHVRCVCHILNLYVKDCLKVIDPHLRRVRDSILDTKNSSNRRHKFKRYCNQIGKNIRNLFPMLIIELMKYWIATMIIKMFLQCITMSIFSKLVLLLMIGKLVI